MNFLRRKDPFNKVLHWEWLLKKFDCFEFFLQSEGIILVENEKLLLRKHQCLRLLVKDHKEMCCKLQNSLKFAPALLHWQSFKKVKSILKSYLIQIRNWTNYTINNHAKLRSNILQIKKDIPFSINCFGKQSKQKPFINSSTPGFGFLI